MANISLLSVPYTVPHLGLSCVLCFSSSSLYIFPYQQAEPLMRHRKFQKTFSSTKGCVLWKVKLTQYALFLSVLTERAALVREISKGKSRVHTNQTISIVLGLKRPGYNGSPPWEYCPLDFITLYHLLTNQNVMYSSFHFF